jgi:hypothetical protein
MMRPELYPSTERIRALIAEEIAAVGGAVSECFDDGRRLFLRAVLPTTREVRPRDCVRGGVAVMTINENIRVCPYLFRQVCRNGAILPQVIRVREVRRLPQCSAEVEHALLQEVRACTSAEVLASAVTQMQSAATWDASYLLHLLPFLGRLPDNLVAAVLARFERESDRSAFGLMNAVTSVARDDPDSQTRWRLEELGGGILARLPRTPRCGAAAAELVRS